MSSPPRRRPGRPRKWSPEQLRALILVAARSEFARTGLVATTIEQIAAAAGVSRQSVYEQFEDKKTLFNATLSVTLRDARTLVERLDREHELKAPGCVSDGYTSESEFDGVLGRFASKLRFELDHPEYVRLIHEGDRVRHPLVAEYRRWQVERDAASLRELWVSQGNCLASGRMPELLASIASSLVRAMLDTHWDGERPGLETMAEILAVFTTGGMGTLGRRAPNVVTALS